jgi:hypothetical protein
MITYTYAQALGLGLFCVSIGLYIGIRLFDRALKKKRGKL